MYPTAHTMNRRSSMNIVLMIIVITLLVFGPLSPSMMVRCWLFSPRIAPYYYPFPYPVPASILPGGGASSSSSSSGLAPTGTGYIGQTSIGASPDYNYNWYNYQSNPNSNVLFPSLSGGGTSSLGGIGSGLTGNTGFGVGGGATSGLGGGGISSMMPVPGSLLRSWWTRKFTKLGLRSPGSMGGVPGMGGGVLGLGGGLGLGTSSLLGGGGGGSSLNPCINGYWASGGVSGGGGTGYGPCSSNNNLCCYPLVVQTTVDSTARPYHTDSVTYPTTGYLYQPHGYKTSASTSGQHQQQQYHQTLRPQASEQVDEIVAESSSRDVD